MHSRVVCRPCETPGAAESRQGRRRVGPDPSRFAATRGSASRHVPGTIGQCSRSWPAQCGRDWPRLRARDRPLAEPRLRRRGGWSWVRADACAAMAPSTHQILQVPSAWTARRRHCGHAVPAAGPAGHWVSGAGEARALGRPTPEPPPGAEHLSRDEPLARMGRTSASLSRCITRGGNGRSLNVDLDSIHFRGPAPRAKECARRPF